MALKVDDIVGKTWNQAYASGHRCGYMDAVSEIWLYMKDIPAGDPRWAILTDLAHYVHDRRDAVLAHADDAPSAE